MKPKESPTCPKCQAMANQTEYYREEADHAWLTYREMQDDLTAAEDCIMRLEDELRHLRIMYLAKVRELGQKPTPRDYARRP